ncbi:hypothetical protein ACOZ38_25410 [Sphaerisporangium viridialbum]|uniref:hypothetical protein n=1 Tax=Sphaerisporangium viridialbum TaxID=46189 RepID=UPI003C7503A2
MHTSEDSTPETEPRTITDWRGNPYTVGTTIFYPRMSGRSCEMAEAVVVDIYDVVWGCDDKIRWERFDPENPAHQAASGRNRVTRVKVQPTGRGSRDFYRSDRRIVKDENGETVRNDEGYAVWEKTDIKPVTLMIINNITVPTLRNA